MNLVNLCIRIKVNLPSGTAQSTKSQVKPGHPTYRYSSLGTLKYRVIPRAMINTLVSLFFRFSMFYMFYCCLTQFLFRWLRCLWVSSQIAKKADAVLSTGIYIKKSCLCTLCTDAALGTGTVNNNKSWPVVCMDRRKSKLIEGNAKCRHPKKLTCKGTLRQVFICLRPRTPHQPPPLHTVYVYTSSHRDGGGVIEPERRLEGQQSTKLGRNTNMTDYI